MKPYLRTVAGVEEIVIPLDAEKRYRWWQDGQSLLTTLEELGASEETKARYRHGAAGHDDATSTVRRVHDISIWQRIAMMCHETAVPTMAAKVEQRRKR